MSHPRIAFFGYHSIGARCLAALLARGAQVCAVLTHQDSPEEPVWFESVADLARRHNLLVLSPPSPNTPETLQFLRTLDPDFFIDFGDERPHQIRLEGGDSSSDSFCYPS